MGTDGLISPDSRRFCYRELSFWPGAGPMGPPARSGTALAAIAGIVICPAFTTAPSPAPLRAPAIPPCRVEEPSRSTRCNGRHGDSCASADHAPLAIASALDLDEFADDASFQIKNYGGAFGAFAKSFK